MVFKVILEPSEDGGHTALVPALPGCISEGDSIEHAMANVREAIELYLEPIDEPPSQHYSCHSERSEESRSEKQILRSAQNDSVREA